MAQGYDPAKAALYNKLIQDGIDPDAALKQAGISSANLGNYEVNDAGQIGQIEIGFGKNPGVNNVTGTAAGRAIDNAFNSSAGPVNFNDTGPANFNDTGAVSASSVKSTSSTTTTTSGGGSTLRIADVGTTTPESAAYEAKANATYGDIKSISRELGPPQFGGNPNLSQEERNALVAQRTELYQQYNQDSTASTNSLAPSAPVGSVTTANTTTDTQTTEYATASTNAPVSGANDTQLQQQEIVRTAPDYNAGLAGTDTNPAPVDPNTDPQAGAAEYVAEPVPASDVKTEATAVQPGPASGQIAYDDEGNLMPGYSLDEGNNPVFVGEGFVEPATQASADATRASRVEVGAGLAGDQQNNSDMAAQFPINTDWRVMLRLAPSADYMYKAADPGLLAP